MIYVYDSICRSFYYLTWFVLWLKYCFKANFENKRCELSVGVFKFLLNMIFKHRRTQYRKSFDK